MAWQDTQVRCMNYEKCTTDLLDLRRTLYLRHETGKERILKEKATKYQIKVETIMPEHQQCNNEIINCTNL